MVELRERGREVPGGGCVGTGDGSCQGLIVWGDGLDLDVRHTEKSKPIRLTHRPLRTD